MGSIFIRAEMGKGGTMSGNKTWAAHGRSLSGISFTLNEVGDTPAYVPKVLQKVGDSIMTVSVSWEFKASK